MAQVVSRQPLTAEGWVHTLVNPCGICGGQSGSWGFLRVLRLSLSISFHWGSVVIYHPGDEK